jgi:hypothetical protein
MTRTTKTAILGLLMAMSLAAGCRKAPHPATSTAASPWAAAVQGCFIAPAPRHSEDEGCREIADVTVLARR